MDRRERILGMGYLIKAPVKSKDKAAFAKFWKLRWLVLTEVLFVDGNEFVDDSKLVFSYYKDKDSHAKDEAPKGTLNLSNCKSIKSCFQAQASYDHSFMIEFNDGKVVRFSAPSCEKKFKWVSLLYKYTFDKDIGGIMQALGIPGASSNQMSHSQKRASICSNGGPTSRVRSVSAYSNGRNSVVFSSHDTVDDSSEEPPPLPPRRPSTISGNSSLFNDSDPSSPTTRSPVNPNEVDLGLLQTFNDLFMLCSKCKAEGQSKSGFQRKKRASKKWAGQQEDVEVREENVAKCQSANDSDGISQFSNTSDDFFVEDPYTKIDDILLEKVKTLKEMAEKAKEEGKEPEEESINEESTYEVKKESEDLVGNTLIPDQPANGEAESTEDVYMDMSQFEQEAAPQNEVTNHDPEPAKSQQEPDYDGSMKMVFEMSC